MFTPTSEGADFIQPTQSVLARLGAKSQLRDWLVKQFPKCFAYVEPFGGSFKVLLWKPYIDRVEIINDIDQDLVHFFRYVAFDADGLCRAINALPAHEAIIIGMRADLADGKLSGLERAVAFYVCASTAFNGMIGGSKEGRYACSPHSRIDCSADVRRMHRLANRLRKVSIRSTGFERLILGANKDLPADKYPPGGVFFYLDPPYWMTEGYSTLAGKSTFGWREQRRLAELCYEIHQRGNKFIQTNSAHPDLHRLYSSFTNADGSPCFYFRELDVSYAVARSGSAAEGQYVGKEYAISNFPLDVQEERNKKQTGLFRFGE